MTDITTVETVTCGGYEVRVGQQTPDEVGGWAAMVTDTNSNPSNGFQLGMMSGMSIVGGSGDGASSDAPGPVVTAPHKWVAVGLAVEAFEWADTPGADVEVDAAAEYAAATVDGDSLADQLVREGGGE